MKSKERSKLTNKIDPDRGGEGVYWEKEGTFSTIKINLIKQTPASTRYMYLSKLSLNYVQIFCPSILV